MSFLSDIGDIMFEFQILNPKEKQL